MKYHKVEITVDMVRRAKDMAGTHGDNHMTIKRDTRSRFMGYLGEEMVYKFISGLTRDNCKDYDFIRWKGTAASYTIDVKTKERTVPPLDKYSVHINEFGNHQQCDTYVFVSIREIKGSDGEFEGWIIGWMDKDEYWDKARIVKKGDVEEKDGFAEYEDSRKMYFKDLNHY